MPIISQLQAATLDPSVIKSSGAGKAYQSVAQSTAIAIQDATDYLRAIEAMTATATGVALAQLVATQDPKWILPIVVSQTVLTAGIANYSAASAAAIAVVEAYPSS